MVDDLAFEAGQAAQGAEVLLVGVAAVHGEPVRYDGRLWEMVNAAVMAKVMIGELTGVTRCLWW